ncbi:unnamed protein product [Cunninghamella echinulata]
MKFFYLVVLFALLKLATADSFLFKFDSDELASQCRNKNYKYINKVTNENVVLGPVIYMNLKNNCSVSENSIADNMFHVCGPYSYERCFQG